MNIKKMSASFQLRIYLSLLLGNALLFSVTGYASFELKGSSARVQAMGQAYVGLANSPDAIFSNCSGLAQLSTPTLSVFYSRPFGMKELNYGSLAAMLPTTIANFGAGLTSFGNELYREQSLLLSISQSSKQNFYYGLNLHYMKLQISGYGSDFSWGIDAGFLIKLGSQSSWGFFATNLNRARMGRRGDLLPQTFCTGISIYPVDNLILNLDIFKDVTLPLEFRCGVEYPILKRIALRGGFTTEPAQFCAGLGLQFSSFEVDYAVTTHQSLGLTQHLSIQWQLNKSQSPTSAKPNQSESKAEAIIPLNINIATPEQLATLPGLDSVLAQRIIEYRDRVGNFKTLEELGDLIGFSHTRLQRITPYIRLE